MASFKKRRSSHIPDSELSVIRKRLNAGEMQHNIAADYGVNQGRISEIKTGKRVEASTPQTPQQ